MIFQRYCFKSLLYRGARQLQTVAPNIQEYKNVKCLCKFMKIDEKEAQYLSMKQPVITKLSEDRIETLVNTLNDIGYSNQDLIKNPGLFGILPITLKFRYRVLKECGIEIVSPALLTRYLPIVKQKTIGELKRSHEVPAHINVENRLASYMTQWPTSLTTLIYEDVNNSTLYLLRLKIIQRYLELVLDLTNEEFHRGLATYPTIKHRPLEFINETLKILLSKIMIPYHKMKTNLYLIHADPENLKNILYHVRTIGGIDIKEVIRMHPKLAVKNYQTLLDIKHLLEVYGISNEAQRRCFDVYTLSPDTLKKRLDKARNTPEFNIFYNHPRFLKMIHYNKTAMQRLSQLYDSNKRCLSLNVLSGCSAHYNIFEKAPGDRLGKGKDLLFCISQSLGKKHNMSHIRNMIRRHPFWMNTPVIQVKYVYGQLSSKFNDDDIYENCPILLYPWNKVRETLNLLNKKSLHELFPIFHEKFNYDALSNSHKLSLILYILEKNHYFSGNGIWTEERSKNPDMIQSYELEKGNTNVNMK